MRAPARPPAPVETNYVTPAGYRRLSDELTFLRTKKRPEVVGALADAAAEGDRSENAEYIYRKNSWRGRPSPRSCPASGHVQIVDPRIRIHHQVSSGYVTVADDSGEFFTYRIVARTRSTGRRARSR